MIKYDLLPRQLIHEGTCSPEDFFEPGIIADQDVLRAHTPEYLHALKTDQLSPKAVRKIGFPWSPELVERELRIAQGTVDGSCIALKTGIAMNIAGGTHHAFSDHGEAFCMLNDQAIAAHYLLEKGLAKKILMLDLDVHQGNGTAEIFRENSQVFTFSMHGEANYPFHKESSDLDIPLEKGINDDQYLRKVSYYLDYLYQYVTPDFVFYLSGVDILATDKLGTLGLTLEGCRRRDELVFRWCHHHEIPVQCSMGGGYSPEIKTILEAHANTYRLANHIYF